MRLLVVGTVPIDIGTVYTGRLDAASDGTLAVDGKPIPHCQGTSAMVGAAASVCSHFGGEAPHVLLGGDIGRGEGTRAVFERLASEVDRLQPDVVAFHYVQPIMALMKKAVQDIGGREGLRLIADAGGMYAAKAAGVGGAFELMTPDVGEVGFLADPAASHPAYVSRYLFGSDEFDPPTLGRLAWELGGAKTLLIKGATDYIVDRGEVVSTVQDPSVPQLEAIGGTGDTLTGLAAGFLATGYPTVDAALLAARVNRQAGLELDAQPDHRAADLVRTFPQVIGAQVEALPLPS